MTAVSDDAQPRGLPSATAADALPRGPPSAIAAINWAAVDRQLLLDVGDETQKKRRRVFNSMSFVKKGAQLTYSEVEVGLTHLMEGEAAAIVKPFVDDLRPAIHCAWNASVNLAPSVRKRPKKGDVHARDSPTLDLSEFHACLLSLREFLEISAAFNAIDCSHIQDRLLSRVECERCMPVLAKYGIQESDLQYKFPDRWNGSMKFYTFAEWCLRESVRNTFEHLTLDFDFEEGNIDEGFINEGDFREVVQEASLRHNTGAQHVVDAKMSEEHKRAVLQLFMDWDTDNSGSIEEDEFCDILRTLNPNFTPEMVHVLFVAADTQNRDGRLHYQEFIDWLFAAPRQ